MRRSTILAAALLAASCSADLTAELTPVDTPESAIVPLPDPELQGGHVGRAARRLTVRQLKKAIVVATGREWRSLDNLAASLGQADYALVNAEGTEPNLVFAKFLEDGAREVCLEAARADLAAASPAERVLAREFPADLKDLRMVHQDDVLKNLTYLSTRFWGQPLKAPELEKWVQLYRDAATRAQTVGRREQALAVVCIAMMTDPRFLTY
ncbi:MAG: hypothetical protein ACK4N5_12360 [Myxococcales bacterium]